MIEAMLFFLFVVGVIWMCLRDELFRRAVLIVLRWGFIAWLVCVCVALGFYFAGEPKSRYEFTTVEGKYRVTAPHGVGSFEAYQYLQRYLEHADSSVEKDHVGGQR
jgi:hypothetical protein